MDDSGIDSRQGQKMFCLLRNVQTASGAPTPFAMRTEDFPGRGVQKFGKWLESEADHSPQCGMNAANAAPTTSAVGACARKPYVHRHKKNSVYAVVQNLTEKSGL